MGLGPPPNKNIAPPPNEMKPISTFGLELMFFAFSITYLTSQKSPPEAEIFSLGKIVAQP